jgi:hypothetical protein
MKIKGVKVAAGEGVEPSISAFKAQRVASYTIPQTTDTETRTMRRDGRGDTEREDGEMLKVSPYHHVSVSSVSLVPVSQLRGTGIRTQNLALIWRQHRL